MPHKIDAHLWGIPDVGSEILEYTAGKTRNDYLQDRQLRRSVERCFTIIGEVLVRIGMEFPEDHARIVAGSKAIGFRNHLVHPYHVVNDDEVWAIVEVSLPLLLKEVKEMLETRES